jgi:hypothetical protein
MLPMKVVEVHKNADPDGAIVMLSVLSATVPPLTVDETTGVVAAHAALVPAQKLIAIWFPANVPERVIAILFTEASTVPVLRTVIGLVTV